jgi:predicted HTH domain antitoxin
MVLNLREDILKQAGLTEHDAVIEFACRLFDAGKLDLWPAAQLAGLSRVEMEEQLFLRKIPIYRPTVQDLLDDLATLDRLGV